MLVVPVAIVQELSFDSILTVKLIADAVTLGFVKAQTMTSMPLV